jgi:hypothetical protein
MNENILHPSDPKYQIVRKRFMVYESSLTGIDPYFHFYDSVNIKSWTLRWNLRLNKSVEETMLTKVFQHYNINL